MLLRKDNINLNGEIIGGLPEGRRTEVMIDAIGGSNDPLIIQFYSISRRYRAASIQAKARQLITQIAQRNNWTEDELADRTIPTAGLDDSGVLTLDYGERSFTAKN